ncbi:CoA activase [bacterium]|nr:CoA activase [bacterium]
MEDLSSPVSGLKVLVGLDIGSVSVNMAIVGEDCKVIRTAYVRHKGQPISTVIDLLEDLSTNNASYNISQINVTGSAGSLLAGLLDAQTVNEVIAQARATAFFHPEVRTVIEIGGEDSKMICLDWDECLNMACVQDFAMNSICAAGTGSFLDQQATRLGLSIEEFGHLALKSQTPPRIAGRCSVFAKSDMIHLQQEAAPDYDIVAGLCFAMARNFKGSIGRGKPFLKPVSFQGGVAANKGMVRAFESVLGLEPGELIIPKHFTAMGAIGACILQLQKTPHDKHSEETPMNLRFTKKNENNLFCHSGEDRNPGFSEENRRLFSKQTLPGDFEFCNSSQRAVNSSDLVLRLKDYLKQTPHREKSLPRLNGNSLQKGDSPAHCECTQTSHSIFKHGKRIGAYLGIDIGSISTNLVVIDLEGRVLAKRYLMTAGRPIEAVRQGLDEIGREIGDHIEILGVGTTGSGRYLIADFVGGDIVKNEITAQARAAAAIDSKVDTIFEIGGQDSKYIRLENGAVVDFEMNKVCAAGTGSFLEEQAERLGINIKDEFGNIALQARSPVSLGERCTVFMESDLVHHQQNGASKDDLIAGLAYSICYNYLNRVVVNRPVGQNIFFQGGVAFNKSVVAAFQKVTGKPIIVPPHHEVTGAIGVALIAKEKRDWEKSRFKGFDLSHRPYSIESFECKGCSNVCQVRKVIVEGEDPLFYGSRCERFDVKRRRAERNDIPDLFAEREKLLLKDYFAPPITKNGIRVGLPRALFFHELMPLWRCFFQELGCEVVISDQTNKPLIDQGIQAIAAEFCFPVKVAHGHIVDLINKKVDYIFLPSIISMPQQDGAKGEGHIRSNFNCPYVQTIPYTVKSAIDFKKHGVVLLDPVIRLNNGEKGIRCILIKVGKELGIKKSIAEKAADMALISQRWFYEAISKRGKEIISGLNASQRAIVVVSRPYNGCDHGINLQIPKIFSDLGYVVLPLDFLPIDQLDISHDWPNMYWRYGRRILSAAEIIRNDPRLFCVYITNFGCGPDSFIIKFFDKGMEGKPYLQMEIDEHSADAGAITRCEAFADSLGNIGHNMIPQKEKSGRAPVRYLNRTLFIPYMCDHAHAIQAAFESSGIDARVMEESGEETQVWGRRYTSGKECYPCIVTTGDMIRTVNSPGFDPENSAFFMPGGDGPCRFGQYNRFHRLVLDEMGFPDVPIYSPTQGEEFYKELGLAGDGFIRKAWQGVIAVDFLDKWLRHTRPYEINQGETEDAYQKALAKVCNAIRLKKPIAPVLKKIKKEFQKVGVDHSRKRPVIGMVGEIFVRSNRFSNNHIVATVERLGGEAWLPPVAEWFLYVNYTSKIHSLQNKNYGNFFSILIKDLIQGLDESMFANIFDDLMPHAHDPSIKKILKNSEPYLHESFEGEAILSVGKAIDFSQQKICGLINIMPFTCMPGTITNAILKRVREEHGLFPFLNMAYDGLEQSNTMTRLEAFMYQAHQYMERQSHFQRNPHESSIHKGA